MVLAKGRKMVDGAKEPASLSHTELVCVGQRRRRELLKQTPRLAGVFIA
jgi:hypothetical protein